VGEVKYNDYVNKDFYLENTGKVTFEYKIILSSIIRKGLVEVTPLEGKIAGQEKQKFILKLCPGFPDLINEKIFL
jgi:hydrocephalus-inducing protein